MRAGEKKFPHGLKGVGRMKTVILCGGRGTRMREETEFRPKPLVEVGDKPILWHIMKTYAHYGFDDFILCLGYKGDMIKRYFLEMCWRSSSLTITTDQSAPPVYHTEGRERWRVTLVDTGQDTLTGGRIKQIEPYIDGQHFMLTYGDGLCDVNISELYEYHKSTGRLATLTGVHPVSPFGVIQTDGEAVVGFKEKPVLEDLINGGYMVLDKKVFDYIPETDCSFEQEPLHRLATEGQLAVYRHNGFWTAIDTHKDVERVNQLWASGERPWKCWL